jgi:hypothetical protein
MNKYMGCQLINETRHFFNLILREYEIVISLLRINFEIEKSELVSLNLLTDGGKIINHNYIYMP